MTAGQPSTSETGLDQFYSAGSIAEWRAVLGPELHYHNGCFEGSDSLEAAVQRTVRNFYAHLAPGSRVFDLGCGWGGPAAMLVAEQNCQVTGVTASRAQAAHCRERGLDARACDVESEPIDGDYDVVFALESFCHIRDKRALLARLRERAGRLVLSVNCTADGSSVARTTFAGTMALCTPAELHGMMADTGWQVVATTNRRAQAMPTLLHWKHNLERAFGQRPPGHLGVLWDFTAGALRDPMAWAAGNPLIDVVAQ